MMNLKLISIVVALFALFGCKAKQNNTTVILKPDNIWEDTQNVSPNFYHEKRQRGVIFWATGNEPFWSLELMKDQNGILTRMGQGTVFFMYKEDVIDGVEYYVSNSVYVKVLPQKCTDSMSGEERKFHVELLNVEDEEVDTVSGCGIYLGDTSLHDIWGLKAINDIPFVMSEKGTHPNIEINISNYSIMGNLGCNHFSTSFYFDEETLVVGSVRSTKVYCPAIKVEHFLRNFLSGQKLTYKRTDNVLVLNNGIDILQFVKGD